MVYSPEQGRRSADRFILSDAAMTFLIIAGAAALLGGIYVGLGAPGYPGRQDRVVTPGRARRLKPNYIHWLRIKR